MVILIIIIKTLFYSESERSFTISVDSPLTVSIGSVIGVFIDFPSYENLPVIGHVENFEGNYNNDGARLCHAPTPKATDNNIICSPVSNDNLVLHMEIEIRK